MLSYPFSEVVFPQYILFFPLSAFRDMAFNFPIGYHIKETKSLAGTASGKAASLLRARKAAGIETEEMDG